MKKIVASVGLVALGASSIHTALAQDFGAPDNSKFWSISATLRGFYDDNFSTWPNHSEVPPGFHRSTFGFEVSPAADLHWSSGQTTAGVGLLYSYRYYENRPIGSSDHDDQVFTFNGHLEHAFNERYQISVRDSFALGQEPDLLRAGNTFATFQRISGDNIRNYGVVALNGELTPQAGFEISYDNAFYDYDAEGGSALGPSLSGLLDRIEHGVTLEGRWNVQPQTHAILGYRFRNVLYTADEEIATLEDGTSVVSDDRDNRSHYAYIGLDHNFRPDLSGSVRGGVQYVEFYNDPTGKHERVTPYARASIRWTYTEQSFVEAGFSYDRNAYDVIVNEAVEPTRDAQSATVFASVNHQIMPNFFGSLIAQFQDSVIEGGPLNNEAEQYYLVGLNFEYRFNPHFSANAGYNYDRLESDIGRMFDRNRVYLGFTARY